MLRGVLVVAGSLCLLEGAYVVFALGLLPRYFEDAARRAGLELTFAALQSWYPGRVQLEAPRVVGPGGWSLASERLDLRFKLPSLVSRPLQIARAHAENVTVHWSNNHLGPAQLRLQPDGTPEAGRHGWVFVDGPQARLQLGAWAGQVDLHGHVRLQQPADAPGFRSTEGAITASASQFRSLAGALEGSREQALERTGVQVSLRWSEAGFSAKQGFALRGQLSVAGGDAGVWLDLARASSSVRWMLAELEGQGFELEAAVRMQSGGVAIEQIRLEAGLTDARGAVYWNAQRRGAFLLQRGTGSIGIALSNADVSAELMPDPGWLSRALERARERFLHESH